MNPGFVEGSSLLTPPDELMSNHATRSDEPADTKTLADASPCSSSSLLAAGEDVSQNTFVTAQQSIWSTSSDKPTQVQNVSSMTISGDIDSAPDSSDPLPGIFNAMSLEQFHKVREDLSCLICAKERLELIFGVSDSEVLSSAPEQVEDEVDLTNVAVASIPFVDTVQVVAELPEDVTSDDIPGIVYLPSSSTFGESSLEARGHLEPTFIVSDENSSLGSDESCFIEMDPLPTSDENKEPNAGDVKTVSEGTVLASMISAALEEHAASLDRIRLQYSVDVDCPYNVKTGEPHKDFQISAPYDELDDDAPVNLDLVKGTGSEEHDKSNTEGAVASTARDAEFSAHDGCVPGLHEQFVSNSSPSNHVARELLCVLEEGSHVQGTEESSETDTETFQTAPQSSWEEEMFGLSVSEVKADFLLVLEEVAGAAPLNTACKSYGESNYKICGGCSWLARLRCW